MIKEIKINPKVLSILIKASGYNEEEISQKIKIPLDRLQNRLLTLAELKKISDILKRPLAAFFSDKVSDLISIPDYRLNRSKKMNPEVYLAQRKLEYLIKKLEKLGINKTQLPDSFEELSPKELSERFRKHLGVNLIKNKMPDELLEIYKNAIETKFNIIIIEQPLKPRKTKERIDDVRGFSIYGNISGIVLNETDHPSIKLFTLFHEVCHLLRKRSGICSLELEVEEEFKVESYCNKFAADFLVPLSDLEEELKKYSSMEIEKIVEKLSKIYEVSKQVILLRLLYLGRLDRTRYYELKKYYEEKEKISQFGRRNWITVYKNRVGNRVIEIVKNSLNKNEISFYEALNILDVKVKYAEKFLYN